MKTSMRCDQEQRASIGVGQLLYRLKSTVERVLLSRASGIGGNVWLSHSGLVELMVACIIDILKHGLKSRIRDEEVLLEWLKSSFEYPVINVDQWIRDSLLQYCLKDQFIRLLHNRQAAEEIYCRDAFLRLPPYVESLFSCLMSLEEQQHKFLADIDPALYMLSPHGTFLELRSQSFPVLSTSMHKFTSMECCSNIPADQANGTSVNQASSKNCASNYCFHCVNETLEKLISTVSTHVQEQEQNENKPLESTSTSSNTLSSVVKQPEIGIRPLNPFVSGHRRTRSDEMFLKRTPPPGTGQRSRMSPSPSLLGPSSVSRTNLNQRVDSLEHIRESWLEAKKLGDFIAQREYETSMELERENAHFLLSEMLIGAIEQMKWRNVLSNQWPSYVSTGSTNNAPTIRPAACTKDHSAPSASAEGFSDSSGDNYLTSSSDLSWSRELQSSSEGGGADFRSDVAAITSSGDQQLAGLSTDTGYGTDLGPRSHIRPISETPSTSAEAVAMNLLQRFSQKHFPPAESDEMKFLVSYQDVPQLLLPMPQSVPVAPDEVYAEGFKQKVKLRGTFEWAPPRPQLIFRMHPVPKLKPLLEQQSFKCAGCGMKLDKAYFKRLRYCAYLGKLFCQCCHQGQTAIIPAHVIHRWDFRRLPVSDFSHRFLCQQYSSPVWNVKAVNESLYKAIKALRSVRHLREQLGFCYDYVRTCRLAKELITTNGRLTDLFDNLPSHLIQETDVYSMEDFVQVKDGTLYSKLDSVLLLARYHIESCQYCRAKGFVCEVCKKDDILFPFQSDTRVKRCGACGSCFHFKCLRKRECPKCKRLQSRRHLATQDIIEQEDEFEIV